MAFIEGGQRKPQLAELDKISLDASGITGTPTAASKASETSRWHEISLDGAIAREDLEKSLIAALSDKDAEVARRHATQITNGLITCESLTGPGYVVVPKEGSALFSRKFFEIVSEKSEARFKRMFDTSGLDKELLSYLKVAAIELLKKSPQEITDDKP